MNLTEKGVGTELHKEAQLYQQGTMLNIDSQLDRRKKKSVRFYAFVSLRSDLIHLSESETL